MRVLRQTGTRNPTAACIGLVMGSAFVNPLSKIVAIASFCAPSSQEMKSDSLAPDEPALVGVHESTLSLASWELLRDQY